MSLSVSALAVWALWHSSELNAKEASGPIRLRKTPEQLGQLMRARREDPSLGLADEVLWRYHLPPKTVGMVQKLNKNNVYHPFRLWSHASQVQSRRPLREHPDGAWVLTTNQLGLRRDAQVSQDPVDLRILCTGDSHTDGVCMNSESWPSRLEQSLQGLHPDNSIEVLNAGKGGYSFFNYLGVLEDLHELQPDVFVVAIYGGNDFSGMLLMEHFFRRTLRPGPHAQHQGLLKQAMKNSLAATAQCYGSYLYFKSFPDQKKIALAGAKRICREIASCCEMSGIIPVFVYLPAEPDIRHFERPKLYGVMDEALQLSDEDMQVHNQMADNLLGHLARSGKTCVDLRGLFAERKESLFWKTDLHLNLNGHLLFAESVLEPLERLIAAQ